MHRFEYEVVLDAQRAVAGALRVEDEFRLGRSSDVVVEPVAALEVQLGGDRAIARGAHDQMQMAGPPRVPAGRLDQLACGSVGRDLVGGGLDGGDLEPAPVVADDDAAEVALGNVGGEA